MVGSCGVVRRLGRGVRQVVRARTWGLSLCVIESYLIICFEWGDDMLLFPFVKCGLFTWSRLLFNL